MKIEPTFEAKIMLGLRKGYGSILGSQQEVMRWLQDYCDKESYCVTVTPTTFIYKDGHEEGAIIGLINYPRFPATKKEITLRALEMAAELKKVFNQNRVSVVCDNHTFLIEDSDLDKLVWKEFLR